MINTVWSLQYMSPRFEALNFVFTLEVSVKCNKDIKESLKEVISQWRQYVDTEIDAIWKENLEIPGMEGESELGKDRKRDNKN